MQLLIGQSCVNIIKSKCLSWDLAKVSAFFGNDDSLIDSNEFFKFSVASLELGSSCIFDTQLQASSKNTMEEIEIHKVGGKFNGMASLVPY